MQIRVPEEKSAHLGETKRCVKTMDILQGNPGNFKKFGDIDEVILLVVIIEEKI